MNSIISQVTVHGCMQLSRIQAVEMPSEWHTYDMIINYKKSLMKGVNGDMEAGAAHINMV